MERNRSRILVRLDKFLLIVTLALIFGMLIVPVEGRKRKLRNFRWNQNEVRNQPRKSQRSKKAKQQVNRPNIIFILADDLGWNDVGYHGSEIETPSIDALSKQGVRLENYYGQALCSPTRASILTGRYQSRTGINRVLDASEVGCLPLHLTTLPERLKVYGYSNHLVGKWHLGFSRRECLPTRRGFDSFIGPYTGYVDHFTRMKIAVMDNTTYTGYDFHKDEEPSYLYQNKYSTHVYTQEAEKIIKQHSKNKKPLFLFLSLQAVHTPNQAPKYYMKSYNNKIKDEMRKSHAAMTTCMDTAVGRIEEALKDNNMWRNTVLIFSSDNGGALAFGADNSPLRGYKGTYLEGGIRVVAFIASPLLPWTARGTVNRDLMGAADWFPTLIEGVAGGSTKYLAVDGYNMWDSIRLGYPSQRTEYLYTVGGNCDWRPNVRARDKPMYGSIRIGVWKLILGHISQKPHRISDNSNYHNIFLYNLALDPREWKNLYPSQFFVFYSLLERLRFHCRSRVPYIPLEESELSDPELHGGVFRPWIDHIGHV